MQGSAAVYVNGAGCETWFSLPFVAWVANGRVESIEMHYSAEPTGALTVLLVGTASHAAITRQDAFYPGCDLTSVMGISINQADCANRQLVYSVGSEEGYVDVVAGGFSCVAMPPVTQAPCFTYNPAAITNACVAMDGAGAAVPRPVVTTEPTTIGVPTATPTLTPTEVCILGPICATVPVPGAQPGSMPLTVPVPGVGFGEQPILVPTPAGYVEATVLCAFSVPCRVTL